MEFGNFTVERGKALPLGAVATSKGVNFSVFSRHARAITLVIFESAAQDSRYAKIELDVYKNKTGDMWHCHVLGLKAGALYLYQVDGEYNPEKGLRFNVHKALLDPYAKALTDLNSWDLRKSLGYNPDDPATDISFSYQDDLFTVPRCIVVDDADFDWQGDHPLNYPLRLSVLYETHVKGLTAHPNSQVAHPGTYRGVIEKIPFFKDLGITSLEFLPIHEFNEGESSRINPRTGETLRNYWGYSTVSFFAPKGSYSSDRSLGGQVREFKEMVRELHKAGLEVILDIVLNHTAEGSERGPTFCFRGFDNTIYYTLDANKRFYKNYSGCGNTVNCNNPVVRSFILDCLHYWVMEMHVDGFRFDLGSILGRDQDGRLIENPPILERIAEDPILRHTKVIAEAWDAGGAYQVGWFPGRWAEWNDRYRDDVRRFWRGDAKQTRHLATRLAGSSDLYLRDGRKPFHSINFITSHDGFTLKDLVSFNVKHNEENGEENRDGNDNNYSYNNGFEGPSTNPVLEHIREQMLKNFLATLMVSLGTPMLLGGDEIARTQKGNNNAYCQDNELSWYDWSLLEKNKSLFRFAKEIIAFRLRHPGFMRPEFYTGRDGTFNAMPDIIWFDEKGNPPDWDKLDTCLALRIDGSKAEILADRDDNDFFIMFNAGEKQVPFKVCRTLPNKKWFRAVDTGFPSPYDIYPVGQEQPLPHPDIYLAKSKSLVVLISKQL